MNIIKLKENNCKKESIITGEPPFKKIKLRMKNKIKKEFNKSM